MSFLKSIKLAAAAATVVIGTATMGSALTFGSIPGGAATNDGVNPIYGTSSRDGWYGAQLYLIGATEDTVLEFAFLGREAGFNNIFSWNNEPLTFQNSQIGDNTWTNSPAAAQVVTRQGAAQGVTNGLLTFAFISPLGTVQNGSNPDGSTTSNVPDIFYSFANPNAASGQELIAWFDDNGAGDDDNHDDMAIRFRIVAGPGSFVAPIPLPAAGWLLIGGIGALVAVRRRKKSDA